MTLKYSLCKGNNQSHHSLIGQPCHDHQAGGRASKILWQWREGIIAYKHTSHPSNMKPPQTPIGLCSIHWVKTLTNAKIFGFVRYLLLTRKNTGSTCWKKWIVISTFRIQLWWIEQWIGTISTHVSNKTYKGVSSI